MKWLSNWKIRFFRKYVSNAKIMHWVFGSRSIIKKEKEKEKVVCDCSGRNETKDTVEIW
jgi:hypothetical protein